MDESETNTSSILPSELKVSKLVKYFYLNMQKNGHERTRIELNDVGLYLSPQIESNHCSDSKSSHKHVSTQQLTEQQISLCDIVGTHCDRHYPSAFNSSSLSIHSLFSFAKSDRKSSPLDTVSPTMKEEVTGDVCNKSPNSCRNLQSTGKKEAKNQSNSDSDTVSYKVTAYLTIFAYLLKTECATDVSSHQRKRFILTLPFCSFPVYEHNLEEAQQWQRAIQYNRLLLIQRIDSQTCLQNISSYMRLLSSHRSLLILLNPKSGSGKSKDIFQKQVVPILNESGMHYELIITTHPNCARDFIKNCPDLLLKYGGIVIASGDGLFFEVLNGIMERDDWQKVTQELSMGIIPCGSGNGLARSIAHEYGESFIEPTERILNAILTCVSGRSAPLDVVRVEHFQDSKSKLVVRLYSILSVGWGFIADVDIGSERLRFIGSQRFTLWSLYRLINLKVYKGRVSYLPYWKSARNSPVSIHEDKQWKSSQQSSECDKGEYENNNKNQQNNNSYSTMILSDKIEQSNLRDYTMPPHLSEPIPSNWCTEEGEFIMVHAAYTTHLASDCHFVPEAKLNDGIIYLVLIRAGIFRMQLAKFLIKMSMGTHFQETSANSHHIQVIPVCAFRIEPQDTGDIANGNGDGILTVDGERVPYGPIQAGIIPGLMKVMVPSSNATDAHRFDAIKTESSQTIITPPPTTKTKC